MNLEILDPDIAKEVLTIIYCCNKEDIEKIPDNIIFNLSSCAADSLQNILIDKTKNLYEQDLHEESIDYFALIYYMYIANESDKNVILSTWISNEHLNN